MTAVAGHSLVLQFDREQLLDLIQANVTVGGVPLQAPFRLRVPGQTSAFFGPTRDRVDIVVRSVRLSLEPGTTNGRVGLGVEAGIVRLEGGPEVRLAQGELQLKIEFVGGGLPKVKPTGLSLHNVGAAANLTEPLRLAVDKLLDTERDKEVALITGVAPAQTTLLAFSRGYVVDTTTLAIVVGEGRLGELTRFLAPGRGVGFAVAGDRVEPMLCRNLLEPSERDPEWRGGGPTDLERSRLPGPCGTGHLARGNDDADVRITRLEFTFRDGYIDIAGSFDAEGFCWSVSGGTFSQQVFMTIGPGPGGRPMIFPRLEPPEPKTNYEVDVDFWCKVVIAAPAVLIGYAVWGTVAFFGADLAAGMFQPSVPGQQIASVDIPVVLPGVRWDDLAVTAEGLVFQGQLATTSFSDAHSPSKVSMHEISMAKDVVEGPGGTALYRAPTCEPREFRYRDFSQVDAVELSVVREWLIEPLQFEWTVAGARLPVASGSPLQFTATVRTALPPPDGQDVPGHRIELAYEFPYERPTGLPDRTDYSRLALTPRAADLRYSLTVTVRVEDGAARVFWSDRVIDFKGVWVQFGPDYDQYRDDCFRKARAIVDRKAESRRPRPGEPNEGLDWTVQYLQDQLAHPGPGLQDAITAAARLHGLAALHKALSERAAQGRG